MIHLWDLLHTPELLLKQPKFVIFVCKDEHVVNLCPPQLEARMQGSNTGCMGGMGIGLSIKGLVKDESSQPFVDVN